MSLESQLVWKFWDIANAITAFSAAQSIAFSYSLTNSNFVVKLKDSPALMYFLFIALLLGGILYFFSVVWCYKNSLTNISFLKDGTGSINYRKLWINVTIGRLVIICFFTLFTLIILLGMISDFWLPN